MATCIDEVLHVYCRKGVKAKLKALASSNRRSLSSEVQQLIEQEHERRFGKKKPALLKPNLL